MTPREHANLLGLFMLIFAGLQLLVVGAIAVVYLAFAGVVAAALSEAPRRAGDPPPEVIIGFVFMIMIIALIVTVLFMVPKIVAGYGLRKGKSWAKIWTIIACVLAVLNFPLGTAVGVYGFWFVFGDEGKAFFDNPDFFGGPRVAAPPPPPNSWQQ